MIVFSCTKPDGESKEFRFPEALSDITLQRFCAFKNEVDTTKPESYAKFELAKNENERKSLTDGFTLQEIEAWQDYFFRFVAFWCDMPEEWMGQLTEEHVAKLYVHINQALAGWAYKEKDSFRFDGTDYYYPPAPDNTFYEKKEYLKGARLIDTITAMQFELFAKQLGNEWTVLPNIIAILCKRKGEEMPLDSVKREQWIQDRGKLFEQLPLDEALNVAFFLARRRVIYLIASNQYSDLRYQAPLIKGLQRFGSGMAGIPFTNRLLRRVSSIAQG